MAYLVIWKGLIVFPLKIASLLLFQMTNQRAIIEDLMSVLLLYGEREDSKSFFHHSFLKMQDLHLIGEWLSHYLLLV